MNIPAEKELTGGRVNYYLVRIDFPQREEQEPYTAECEDIIAGLKLTPDEANVFKEIWRSANARQGNGKPDHKAMYGAEKILHYAGRILRAAQIAAGTYVRLKPANTVAEEPKKKDSTPWYENRMGLPPEGYDSDTRVRVRLRCGEEGRGSIASFYWGLDNNERDITQWRLYKPQN